MFIPYHVDVPYDRRPFANWLILGVIVAVFCQQIAVSLKYGFEVIQQQQQQQEQTQQDGQEPGEEQSETEQAEPRHPLDSWILHGWNLQGLVGHMWMHAGLLHLLGNMLFLWVFGNAVCAKIGNKLYPLFYLGLGFAAAATHLIFDGGPMLGASGAINGIVGMYLVFFPENDISCLWILFFPFMKRITVSSYWIILMWFVFDVLGAMVGGGNTAYFAHVGGFAAGFVLAIFMLERKWVTMEEYEKSLLQLVGVEKKAGLDGQMSNYGTGWELWQSEISQEQPAQNQPNSSEAANVPAGPPPPAFESQPPPVAVTEPQPKAVPELIKIHCSCGKKVKFPAKYAGRTGRCPACGAAIKIERGQNVAGPASKLQDGGDDGMIRFSCKCGKKIRVPAKYSGRTGKCPECHAKIVIP